MSKHPDKRESYDQDALDEASRELHMFFLREGSRYGTKACEEIGRMFMTAYLKTLPSHAAPKWPCGNCLYPVDCTTAKRCFDPEPRFTSAPSATERNAVIEECAAVADYLYENGADTDGSVLLVDCSNKIRDLKNRADGTAKP